MAKGVRKTKSRFGARLEPISHVALQLYEGRELDIVTQAESIDHFRAIREDLDRLARASAMLEVVDQVAQEREPNPRLYQMLLGRAPHPGRARRRRCVVPAFFWKLLALEGSSPMVDACVDVRVGRTPLVAFDLETGGVLCVETAGGARDLARGGRAACSRSSAASSVRALDEPDSPATHEVDHLATRALEHHLERRLRSVSLLDRGLIGRRGRRATICREACRLGDARDQEMGLHSSVACRTASSAARSGPIGCRRCGPRPMGLGGIACGVAGAVSATGGVSAAGGVLAWP